MRRWVVALILFGLPGYALYADALLDSATQLIPQDPNHPVNLSIQPSPSVPTPKQEKKPEIVAKAATGENQFAVMDQEGHWQPKSPAKNNVNQPTNSSKN